MIVEELINRLGFTLTGEGELKRFKEGMNDADRAAVKHSEGINAAWGRVGLAAGAAAGAAVVYGAKVVKSAAEAERELNRSIRVTAGGTEKQVQEANAATRRMADEFAMPVAEVRGGLATLISAGMEIDAALAFLPTSLQGAQATGSAIDDISNSLMQLSQAFGIPLAQAQRLLDLMAASGNSGRFEVRDMSQFMPGIASAAAAQGLKGEAGIKDTLSYAQTVREDAPDASRANTQLVGFLGKINSGEIKNAVEKMGGDYDSGMQEMLAKGMNAVEAHLAIVERTIKGDLSKLNELIPDQEARGGTISLLTSRDRTQHFRGELEKDDVTGTANRGLEVVVNDTAAQLERLSGAIDNFNNAVGTVLAGPVGSFLEARTSEISYQTAVDRGREIEGKGIFASRGIGESEEDAKRSARIGGWTGDTKADQDVAKNAPESWKLHGAYTERPVTPTPMTATKGKANADAPQPDPYAAALQNTPGGAAYDAGLANLTAKIEGGNTQLQSMINGLPVGVDAVVTDSRTDARSFPVTVNSTVNQTITQPSAAPSAVATATNAAVGGAVQGQSALSATGPAF